MKLTLDRLANPYIAFAVVWAICLTLYSFGWAAIFPPITTELFCVLAFVIIVFGVTGIFVGKLKIYDPDLPVKQHHRLLLVVNFLFFSANFAYSGIPLLSGTRSDDFGIPTVIVFATTLNCYTSLYCFMLFLVHHKKRYVLYSLSCMFLFVLMFSRGNIMFTLVSMFFLWLNIKKPVLSLKRGIGILSGVLLLLYLFGVAGNIRSIGELSSQNPNFDKTYNSEVIMAIGNASDDFRENLVPGEFFWSYIYITSPLSNLQYNVNKNKPSFNAPGVGYIFLDELLFDSFSKRLDDILGRERLMPDLLIEQLTASTALVGSYNYAGWGGVIIFLFAFWLFPFLYLIIVNKNPLGILGVSVLCTVFFFSMFDNTFSLTGLTFQIIYPVLFNFLSKIGFSNKDDATAEALISPDQG